MAANTPHIETGRLWESLMSLARIGATARGGVCRLALSSEDAEGRAWFIRQAETIGLEVRLDRVGNIYARLNGTEPDLPPVLAGSHLDTQPSGGKFDGAYGVVAGLEAARVLVECDFKLRRSVEVVSWTNEEGSRFLPVMTGSGVVAGVHAVDDVLAQSDPAGVRFADALSAIGAAGDAEPPPIVDAYFEAHIEQGPVLEARGNVLGVVTGALGQRWFECTLTGFEAHAGPTPMSMRRDALQGAAAVISAIAGIGTISPEARATVGMINCWPNSRNTIPGSVHFSIDLRHADDDGLDRMEAMMREAVARAAETFKLDKVLVETNDWKACHFDPACIELVRDAADRTGLPWCDIVSGAGHDAVHIARIAPTAMIFVPCRDGVSHNEIEDAEPEHLAAGANVLLAALIARANR